jgi:hypothetical protein
MYLYLMKKRFDFILLVFKLTFQVSTDFENNGRLLSLDDFHLTLNTVDFKVFVPYNIKLTLDFSVHNIDLLSEALYLLKFCLLLAVMLILK